LGFDVHRVVYEPNLTVLLEYSFPWSGEVYAWMDSKGEDALAWVACENAKTGRIQAGWSVYVIQASTTYSRENLEKEPESWVQDLCEKVEARWGFDPAQRGTTLGHRWRYARRRGEPTGVPTMKDGIFLCGDSESDSRFESVWKSGTKVAQDVLDALG
jgi:predicted NAD/FAD-dependent oxidoreductase